MSVLESLSLTTIPAYAEALRTDIRHFLEQALKDVPPHIRARSWSGCSPEFSRKLGEKGWIGSTIPKQYGGAGLDAFARYVLVEELLNAGAPVAWHWFADRQSAPLLLRYGTEEQKQFYIPAICRGEIAFCIGMSEPSSGSDLASVRTRATRNPNGYVLNGQKIWTSYAHHSQYMIALVRTSGQPENRQQGLSQFIVDLSLPGITIQPITDLCGEQHFCEVFFQDVQLSEADLIGTEGQGWEQVTAELALERSGPERLFSSILLFEEWLAFVRTNEGHTPYAARLAGQVLSRLATLRAMSVSVTSRLAQGESPAIEAALVKDLGTTLEQLIPTLIADDLHSRATQKIPLELSKTLQYITHIAPSYSLRGGTREILRGMIARGLGLR